MKVSRKDTEMKKYVNPKRNHRDHGGSLITGGPPRFSVPSVTPVFSIFLFKYQNSLIQTLLQSKLCKMRYLTKVSKFYHRHLSPPLAH